MPVRVLLGMSGGVDSSTSALILKERGYDVIGVTLKLWPQVSRCCSLEDLYSARRVCHKLGIPHYTFDFTDYFKKKIVDYFVKSYLRGKTPNPCVFCNRFIKFGVLVEKAKMLDCQYIATGHYAKIDKFNSKLVLAEPTYKEKSQIYFLALIKKEVLGNIIFPLEKYTKEQVIKLAKENKLPILRRSESQDLCFVVDRNYPRFIEKMAGIRPAKGIIVDEQGNKIGEHKGFYYYTYGKKIAVWKTMGKRWYVKKIDAEKNLIIASVKEGLKVKGVVVENLNLFIPRSEITNLEIKVKIRYRTPAFKASVRFEKNDMIVDFKEKIYSATPGQIAGIYYNDYLLGGGIIKRVIYEN